MVWVALTGPSYAQEDAANQAPLAAEQEARAPIAASDLVACIAIAALPTLVLSGLKALFGLR